MDISQVILVSVISVLTLMLLFLGFQVFLLLRDTRISIKRLNKILGQTEIIVKSVGAPIVSFSQVLSGLKTTSELLRAFFGSEARGKNTAHKLAKTGKKTLEKIESMAEDLNLDGNGHTEKSTPSFHLQLKPPRFFRGIPKRR